MQVLERETSEKTKNEAKKQDKMKKTRRNESQKQKPPKLRSLGGGSKSLVTSLQTCYLMV